MVLNTFGPALLVNPRGWKPAPGVSPVVRDAETGQQLQPIAMDTEDPITLVSNIHGYVPQFRLEDATHIRLQAAPYFVELVALETLATDTTVVTEAVAEALAARDVALTAADEINQQAAAVQQAVADVEAISGLTGEDAAVALLASTPTSATAGAIQTAVRSEVPLNLRAFGAVGDGVADDTDALKAGIAAAIDTGRALYIPSGTYMIRSLEVEAWLYDGDSLSIYGDGASSVIKRLPGSALSNNQRMIYVRGLGHAESVEIRRLKIDGNARENPLPEGNNDPYLWQQNHSILTSDAENIGSIREVRYEDLVIDDPMADGLSFAGRALGDVYVSRVTVPTRTRTRSDVQFSRPVKAAWVTDCDLKSLEMEWVSQPATPMRLTIRDTITDNLDLGAASLGLNCYAALSNVTAAALAAFRGIQGMARDCTIALTPGSSNEIRSSAMRFVACKFLVASSLLVVHGGGTDGPTAPVFEDCEFIGSAAVVAVNIGTSTSGSISATFRRCRFAGPLVNSIKSDRSGLVRVDDCHLVGTTEALHLTATGGVTNRLEWTAGPNSSVTATSPLRVNSAVADLALILTGSGWAWGEHQYSGQVPVNVRSSRIIMADAAPTGRGIAGDVVRLRVPVAGAPYEWIATVTSGSNAGWKVLSTIPV